LRLGPDLCQVCYALRMYAYAHARNENSTYFAASA